LLFSSFSFQSAAIMDRFRTLPPVVLAAIMESFLTLPFVPVAAIMDRFRILPLTRNGSLKFRSDR
jgi:hypothetical protein